MPDLLGTTSFALAFALDPRAPGIGFFTCSQRDPENFWNPAFQCHANTTVTVAGVVLVAQVPSDHDNFLRLSRPNRNSRAGSFIERLTGRDPTSVYVW